MPQMPRLPPHRHYGLTDVANALGISRQALRSYLDRGVMPEPDDRIASGPIWHDLTIEPWIEERRQAQGKGGVSRPGLIRTCEIAGQAPHAARISAALNTGAGRDHDTAAPPRSALSWRRRRPAAAR